MVDISITDQTLIHVEATYTFRIKISFDGGQTKLAANGVVLTLEVKCGQSSTTLTFGSHPVGLSEIQYIQVGTNGVFKLPYAESSLYSYDPNTNCILD